MWNNLHFEVTSAQDAKSLPAKTEVFQEPQNQMLVLVYDVVYDKPTDLS